MQAYVATFKRMQLHSSFCNCMQAYVTPCKLMELHASSWNCITALGTACKLIKMPAISWNCMQPWETLGNLGRNLIAFWRLYRQPEIPIDHGRTYTHTNFRTCLAASLQPIINAMLFVYRGRNQAKYNFSVIANNSQQIMGLGVTVFGCKCKWLMELLYELLQKRFIKI